MPAPRPSNTISTYSRGTVVMASPAGCENPERVPVLIGNADRIRAKRLMKMDHAMAIERGDGEEWMARAVHSAWKRETGSADDFEVWLERFIGVEYDSDELGEDAADQVAVSSSEAASAGEEEDDPGKARRAE